MPVGQISVGIPWSDLQDVLLCCVIYPDKSSQLSGLLVIIWGLQHIGKPPCGKAATLAIKKQLFVFQQPNNNNKLAFITHSLPIWERSKINSDANVIFPLNISRGCLAQLSIMSRNRKFGSLSKKKNGGIVPLHYGWQPRMSLDLDHLTAIITKPALFIHFPLVFVLTTQFR